MVQPRRRKSCYPSRKIVQHPQRHLQHPRSRPHHHYSSTFRSNVNNVESSPNTQNASINISTTTTSHAIEKQVKENAVRPMKILQDVEKRRNSVKRLYHVGPGNKLKRKLSAKRRSSNNLTTLSTRATAVGIRNVVDNNQKHIDLIEGIVDTTQTSMVPPLESRSVTNTVSPNVQENDEKPKKTGIILNGRYQLLKCLGRGSFGVVVRAKDIQNRTEEKQDNKGKNEEEKDSFCKTSLELRSIYYAVKLERIDVKSSETDKEDDTENEQKSTISENILMLETEYNLLRELKQTKGFCQTYWYGPIEIKEKKFQALVMDLLGPDLEVLLEECDGTFGVKTVCMLGDQMLTRLKHLHEAGFVHRDLKPANFLMGRGNCYLILHLIDFGLSDRYIQNGKHVTRRRLDSMTGTPRFASIRNMKRWTYSRRDDMEALMYILIYLLKGSLPWQSIGHSVSWDVMVEEILKIKASVTLKKLCQGLPHEFIHLMRYCMRLKFSECPNYQMMRKTLYSCCKRLGEAYDFVFEWANYVENSGSKGSQPEKSVCLSSRIKKYFCDMEDLGESSLLSSIESSESSHSSSNSSRTTRSPTSFTTSSVSVLLEVNAKNATTTTTATVTKASTIVP